MTPSQFLEAVCDIVQEHPGIEESGLLSELQLINPQFTKEDFQMLFDGTATWFFLKQRGVRTENYTRFYKDK